MGFLNLAVNSGYKQETIRKIRKTREKFVYQRKLLENLPDFDQSLNEFKTACLKTNSVIFSDENMEISENRQIIQKKGRKFLKVIICFTNKKNVAINGFSIEFFAENGFFLILLIFFVKFNKRIDYMDKSAENPRENRTKINLSA